MVGWRGEREGERGRFVIGGSGMTSRCHGARSEDKRCDPFCRREEEEGEGESQFPKMSVRADVTPAANMRGRKA